MKRIGRTIAEMDANKVLSAIIDSDEDFDWNKSSEESSEDEEETLSLPDPLSCAEVQYQCFYWYNIRF